MKSHTIYIVMALGLSLFFQNCAPPAAPEDEKKEMLTPADLTSDENEVTQTPSQVSSPAPVAASASSTSNTNSSISLSLASSTGSDSSSSPSTEVANSLGSSSNTSMSSVANESSNPTSQNSSSSTSTGSTSELISSLSGSTEIASSSLPMSSVSQPSSQSSAEPTSASQSANTAVVEMMNTVMNPPQEPPYKTESFNVEVVSRAVDMVWVLDNSGGMSASADQMRKYFGPFAKDLANKSNLKTALISKSGTTGSSLSLPSGLSGAVQVFHNVLSSEPLLLAAASMCGIQNDDDFCKSFANGKYKDVYATLSKFFRSDSEKVFVFVSDDDSQGTAANENKNYITAPTFFNRLQKTFPTDSSVKVYGVTSGSSQCGVRKGSAYISLVKDTAGLAFDICASDWAAYFTRLTTDLSQEIPNAFLLSDPSGKVVSVTLNGKLLVPADYVVSVGKVSINKDLLKNSGKYLIEIKLEK